MSVISIDVFRDTTLLQPLLENTLQFVSCFQSYPDFSSSLSPHWGLEFVSTELISWSRSKKKKQKKGEGEPISEAGGQATEEWETVIKNAEKPKGIEI